MITHARTTSRVREQWTAVRKLCSKSGSLLIPGAGLVQQSHPDGFLNLPLVLAYAVLEQVLQEFLKQGLIPKPRTNNLGPLLEAAKDALPWADYPHIRAGYLQRNKLAHGAVLISDAESLAFVTAIEKQLQYWHVIA